MSAGQVGTLHLLIYEHDVTVRRLTSAGERRPVESCQESVPVYEHGVTV